MTDSTAGIAPKALPALRIELSGAVTLSNLSDFRQAAMTVIGAVNIELQSDQDFADAEKAIKWCGEVEKRLDAAREHALSQTASIDELFKALDAIKEESRQKRLKLDKLVKTRKDSIRFEIIQTGRDSLAEHVRRLSARISHAMPPIEAGFAGVIKGKKTVSSMRDAVDSELASAKIAANEVADRIQGNVALLNELAKDYDFLFSDSKYLITNNTVDRLAAIIESRISDHKQREQEREERRLADESAREARESRRQAKPLEDVLEVCAESFCLEPAERTATAPLDNAYWHHLAISLRAGHQNAADAKADVITALSAAGIVCTVKHLTMDNASKDEHA